MDWRIGRLATERRNTVNEFMDIRGMKGTTFKTLDIVRKVHCSPVLFSF